MKNSLFLLLWFFSSLTQAADGRLSTVSGDPAPEVEITTNTLYLTNGGVDLTLSLTSGHLAGKNYDVFEIAGPAICAGPAWASNTIRAIDIQVAGSEIVNAAAMTCINGASTYTVAAGDGQLRGGFRAFTNGLTRSTMSSRLVWDARNPIIAPVAAIDTTDSWSYSAPLFRQANGNPANRIEVFNGLSGRPVSIRASGYMIGSALTSGFVGIGIDTSTADSSQVKNPCAGSNTFPVLPCWAEYSGYVGIGYHEIRWLERGTGTAATWIGDNGYGGYGYQTGLVGTVQQ